jgi:hypothetical protein
MERQEEELVILPGAAEDPGDAQVGPQVRTSLGGNMVVAQVFTTVFPVMEVYPIMGPVALFVLCGQAV